MHDYQCSAGQHPCRAALGCSSAAYLLRAWPCSVPSRASPTLAVEAICLTCAALRCVSFLPQEVPRDYLLKRLGGVVGKK